MQETCPDRIILKHGNTISSSKDAKHTHNTPHSNQLKSTKTRTQRCYSDL